MNSYVTGAVIRNLLGRTVVIDYKFGGVHESYASQMKGYMRLLQSLGKTPIEGHIWYLDTNEIVDVTI